MSDEEVIFKEVQGKLYFLQYQLADKEGNPIPLEAGGITIATVRPETILGDAAIAVNPSDERFIAPDWDRGHRAFDQQENSHHW